MKDNVMHLHVGASHDAGEWFATCKDCRAIITDYIACDAVAVSRMSASWVETKHRAVLWYVASMLPGMRYTHAIIADGTGLCKRTVSSVLAELKLRGLLDWKRTSPDNLTRYTINGDAVRAL